MEQKNIPVVPITRNFIRQFYQDFIRGRFKRPGGEQERAAIQSRIDRAIAAGKIANG
ncbi:MAG: hypothetical protein NTV04_20090 [Deltaproteobacteria bacterium]|nr:hypothetical protein [Deltaproteobacteria bacterium]